MSRTADYVRKTKETDITLSLELDGSGVSEIDTGIGFFDHMLEGFARHGFFDLSVKAEGDLIVDCHHTIEDTWNCARQCDQKGGRGQKGHQALRKLYSADGRDTRFMRGRSLRTAVSVLRR